MNEAFPDNGNIRGEIEQKTGEIQVLFDNLEKIKDRFTRKKLGDDVVDRAESQIRFSYLEGSEDADQDNDLRELGREMMMAYIKDLLTLEPKDEAERQDLNLIRQSLLPDFFPDQTELSVIYDDKLLRKLAYLLETFRVHSDLRTDPEVDDYLRRRKVFDFVLSRQYREYFCAGKYVMLTTGKSHVQFTVPETEDQENESGSIAISLCMGKLFLGDDEVTDTQQLYYINKLTDPLIEIVIKAQAAIENEDR